MTKFLRSSPAAIFLLIAGYFVLNLLVRLAMPDALERDEAQQILLSQWLAAGYDTQPPFYNWIQYAVVKVTGPSVFAVSVLKNAVLFLAYLAYGLAARTVLKDRDLAIIATLGLLTIPQIAFEAQRDLSHTVAIVFAASLFLYGFFRTLQTPSSFSYLLTGVAVGVGLISKYNFAILPAAALLATLPDREWRARLLDPRLAFTVAAALLIVLPHGLWLAGNLGLATERTMDKLAGETLSLPAQIATGFGSLAMAILGFSAVTVAVFAAVFRGTLFHALRQGNRWTALVERILVVFLIVLALLIVFAGASHIKDRWLTPLLLILPLYLCMKLEAAGVSGQKFLGRYLPVPLLIMLLVPAVLFGRVALAGRTGDYQKQNVPYDAFAAAIMKEAPAEPGAVIAEDPHLAGNLRLQFPGAPVVSPAYPSFDPQIAWNETSQVLVVWRMEGKSGAEIPAPLLKFASRSGRQIAPESLQTREMSLPYTYGTPEDSYVFGYAWLYPVKQ
ncbi:glycosyltransferase family 39 protein [Sinorhizobium sp. BG8]|uniref:ArnT family glycosyltransferase n=1 Tax=Sinorhizobium sp. BG8 TaxID=2613773 RepID=UPI00193E8856|nr:glycosyltransferase family 39 protein [Sinorhizobium sp. BG8]QRM54792.1 hypothetical protein F3Y30_09740 [Sinorhizobium sp. BG8]